MKRILCLILSIFLVTSVFFSCSEPDIQGSTGDGTGTESGNTGGENTGTGNENTGSDNENTGSGEGNTGSDNENTGSGEENTGITENTVGGSALESLTYTTSGAGTLYIYSKSDGINIYGVKIGDTLWNVSYLTAVDITANTTLTSNGISATVKASSDKKISIDANDKSCDDIQFTQRLKLGGAGSQDLRCVAFEITKATNIVVYAMSASKSESRTLILDFDTGSEAENIVQPTGISLSSSTLSINIEESQSATLTATLTPENITSGYNGITWTSSDTTVATVNNGIITAFKAGTTTITATTKYGNCSATCEVTVTGSLEEGIRVTDIPTGWASVNANSNFGGNGKTVYTVNTRSDLISKANSGNCIIYLDGMIDMTEGMLPSSGTTSTTKLDEFIANKTSGEKITASSYAKWKTTYAANVKSSEDESGDIAKVRKVLQNAWKSQIQLSIKSNTTIIGLGENSGIKGGTISINGASNIALRNLNIQDAFDPFPKMEKNDGYNAEWDGIVIDNSKNIWIDHCTFEDTICLTDEDLDKVTPSDGVTNKNKWQTYDGLLDVKNASDYVTVSYCLFKNHDKTSIIGSGDGETGDEGHLTVTFNNNYYLNCTQRLPRVRFGKVHAYNNYYTTDGNGRSNSYCFGVGYNAKIYSEANYFGDSIGRASNMMSNSKPGTIYSTGDYNYTGVTSSSVGWTPSYTYKALSAEEAKADVIENAGAGILSVIKAE